MSCTLHHPFTAVVVGPTGCGKTKWVLRLVNNARDVIEPPPESIWYCDGEYQPIFSEYRHVNFQEGLSDMSHEVFYGRCPTLLIIDDLMSETNQLLANIFTKISHHRNISVLYLTQNLFDKNRFARTISLNAHYYVLFKNPRDAIQFATLARQTYPNDSRFALGSIPGCNERSVRISADRPKTRTRRSVPTKNQHLSRRRHPICVRKEIKGRVGDKNRH